MKQVGEKDARKVATENISMGKSVNSIYLPGTITFSHLAVKK